MSWQEVVIGCTSLAFEDMRAHSVGLVAEPGGDLVGPLTESVSVRFHEVEGSMDEPSRPQVMR